MFPQKQLDFQATKSTFQASSILFQQENHNPSKLNGLDKNFLGTNDTKNKHSHSVQLRSISMRLKEKTAWLQQLQAQKEVLQGKLRKLSLGSSLALIQKENKVSRLRDFVAYYQQHAHQTQEEQQHQIQLQLLGLIEQRDRLRKQLGRQRKKNIENMLSKHKDVDQLSQELSSFINEAELQINQQSILSEKIAEVQSVHQKLLQLVNNSKTSAENKRAVQAEDSSQTDIEQPFLLTQINQTVYSDSPTQNKDFCQEQYESQAKDLQIKFQEDKIRLKKDFEEKIKNLFQENAKKNKMKAQDLISDFSCRKHFIMETQESCDQHLSRVIEESVKMSHNLKTQITDQMSDDENLSQFTRNHFKFYTKNFAREQDFVLDSVNHIFEQEQHIIVPKPEPTVFANDIISQNVLNSPIKNDKKAKQKLGGNCFSLTYFGLGAIGGSILSLLFILAKFNKSFIKL